MKTRPFRVIDFTLQTIFMVLTVMFPFSLIGLFLLGCQQMLSSFLRFLAAPRSFYGLYFLSASAYLLLLYFGTISLFDVLPYAKDLEGLGFVLFYIIIPLVAGIYYYIRTAKDIFPAETPSELV